MCIDLKICSHYKEHDPTIILMAEPHDTMIMGELFVCGGCARQKSATHINVLGFLSLSQHTRYKKDAQRCSSLHCNGYTIIPCKEWEDTAPSFPSH